MTLDNEIIRRKIVQGTVQTLTGAYTGTTCPAIDNGEAIDDAHVRHVVRITLSNRDSTGVNRVEIYAGDSVNNKRTQVFPSITLPAYATISLSCDPDKNPLVTVRPDTSAATTTGNRIYACLSAAAVSAGVDIGISHFDEHA